MKLNQGYSLLELCIVMAISSILLCFAYSGFNHYVLRAHRIDGQLALLDLASRMEHYYFEHGTYQKAAIQTGTNNDVLNSNLSAEGLYRLSIVMATDNAYELQATATNTQRHDTDCPVFTYNHLGIRGINASKSVTECWL